jgi:hypothetical protein
LSIDTTWPPFDPALVAFKDDAGAEYRYINSPLDMVYANEPCDHCLAGTLPPEEMEVRRLLAVTILYRNRVSWFDFWWSQFVKPTKTYSASVEYFRKLEELCAKSREHRAAFCRISNSDQVGPGLRHELKRVIGLCETRTK